jgi:hypothetical protein
MHVLWQEADGNGDAVPESTLVVHGDADGPIFIGQAGRYITLNWASVPELIGLLKDMAKRTPQS